MLDGTGVALVTPFDADGEVATDGLREVVAHVEDGVDFLVPCGSTGEAPLMSVEERTRVIEVVAGTSDLPVVAGTGHEGYAETLRSTERAAAAGADAALVVTPYYYGHGSAAVADYYRDLADAAPIPVYLYHIPKYAGSALDPGTVADLASHDGIAGIKDSSGDIGRVGRQARHTPEEFDVLVGAGGVYAHALDAGADGGILALANVVPELAGEVYRRHRAGEEAAARDLNADLAELNRAITARYGVPGVKAALRHRGVPAGRVRRPFRPLDDDARAEVESLVNDVVG